MPLVQPRFLELSEIEARAEEVLREAQQEGVWDGGWPVPLDAIAELLHGQTIEFDDLAGRFGDHGALGDGDLLGAIDLAEKRIWIDQSVDPHEHPKKRARYHFTLAHEIAHWVLHASIFGCGVTSSPRASLAEASIRCRGLDGAPREPQRRPRLEFQADAFAGVLAMPRSKVERLWQDLSASGRAGMLELELARQSQMSRQAAAIRIRELGLQAPAPSVRQGDLFHAA